MCPTVYLMTHDIMVQQFQNVQMESIEMIMKTIP
jgi:hypothetical protein